VDDTPTSNGPSNAGPASAVVTQEGDPAQQGEDSPEKQTSAESDKTHADPQIDKKERRRWFLLGVTTAFVGQVLAAITIIYLVPAFLDFFGGPISNFFRKILPVERVDPKATVTFLGTLPNGIDCKTGRRLYQQLQEGFQKDGVRGVHIAPDCRVQGNDVEEQIAQLRAASGARFVLYGLATPEHLTIRVVGAGPKTAAQQPPITINLRSDASGRYLEEESVKRAVEELRNAIVDLTMYAAGEPTRFMYPISLPSPARFHATSEWESDSIFLQELLHIEGFGQGPGNCRIKWTLGVSALRWGYNASSDSKIVEGIAHLKEVAISTECAAEHRLKADALHEICGGWVVLAALTKDSRVRADRRQKSEAACVEATKKPSVGVADVEWARSMHNLGGALAESDDPQRQRRAPQAFADARDVFLKHRDYRAHQQARDEHDRITKLLEEKVDVTSEIKLSPTPDVVPMPPRRMKQRMPMGTPRHATSKRSSLVGASGATHRRPACNNWNQLKRQLVRHTEILCAVPGGPSHLRVQKVDAIRKK
jgi:hypothetical protein